MDNGAGGEAIANRGVGGRRRTLWLFAAGLGLCATGCGATTSQFKPAGTQAAGSAAYYDIQAGGRVWGDARVWSPDGYLVESDQGLTLTAHMRVRNDTDEPIRLDAAQSFLEYISEDGQFVRVDDAKPAPAATTVPARSTRTTQLSFQLSRQIDADDVRGFEINWFIETPQGRYSESTPFQRVKREGSYYYAPSYYYPYSPFYGGGLYMRQRWYAP